MALKRPAWIIVLMAKVAVPVFRSRVAPVFDSCLRVWVIHIEGDVQTERSELHLFGVSPTERVRALTREGVTTLICGGISDGLHTLLESLGICVVCGIAGQFEDVLAAFMSNRLDNPEFYMPGRRGKYGKSAHRHEGLPNRTADGDQETNGTFVVKQGGDETRPQKGGT